MNDKRQTEGALKMLYFNMHCSLLHPGTLNSWSHQSCQCMSKKTATIFDSTTVYHGAFMKRYSGMLSYISSVGGV